MPKENKQFVICETCKASVLDINLLEHTERVHGKVAASSREVKQQHPAPSNPQPRDHHRKIKNQNTTPPERERLLNFRCRTCKRQTKIPPGQIRVAFGKEDFEFFYEKEVKCRHCSSRELDLSNLDRFFILGPLLAKAKLGQFPHPDADVIFHVGKLSTGEEIDDQNEMIRIMRERTEKNSGSWEVWLRYANVLQFANRYDESLEPLQKAATLNPKAVAPQLILGRVFFNRWKTYQEKEAKVKARNHLMNVMRLLDINGENNDLTTLRGVTMQDIAGEAIPKIQQLGSGKNDIFIAAELSEIEEPLSAFVSDGKKDGKTVILNMSAIEEVAELVGSAASNCLIRYPETSKQDLLRMLKRLSESFDKGYDERTGYLRNTIKLRLLNLRKTKNCVYWEDDFTAGILYLRTLLENDPDAFGRLQKEVRKATE